MDWDALIISLFICRLCFMFLFRRVLTETIIKFIFLFFFQLDFSTGTNCTTFCVKSLKEFISSEGQRFLIHFFRSIYLDCKQ